MEQRPAPGGPGTEPRWTSSAKSGVGTALDGRSHVWFTASHGIIDEIYYPRVDQANTRDIGLLVSGPDGFFSEEKRDTRSTVHLLGPGVPGYRFVNHCVRDHYEIEKTIITDPERSVVLQRIRFCALKGRPADYRLFVLLAPHIGNQGYGNDGWVDEYKGIPMLFARRQAVSLALACDAGWSGASVGYVGVNDGWRQVRATGGITERYTEARDGNVALTGEVDLAACMIADAEGAVAELVTAIAFGGGPAEAAQRARMTLSSKFDRIQASYVRNWSRFHEHTHGPKQHDGQVVTPELSRRNAARDLAMHAHGSTHAHDNMRVDQERGRRPIARDRRKRTPVELPESVVDLYRMSAAVLAIHEDKSASGAMIASLSIPWGDSKGDHELGGYHLVWPRDLVNSAGALIALGHDVMARRTLRFLLSTQEADGRWAQNLWLDGTPYWSGVQMDEIAFPIVFAEMLRREGQLEDIDPWPMIRRAAGFLLRTGPITGQDRWEENGGYSPFSIAVQVAALLIAAEFADRAGEPEVAGVLRHTADSWNDAIDRWTYVVGTPMAQDVGVDGYYVRIAPADVRDAQPASSGMIPIRNRPPGENEARYDEIVSVDALALVRFGLRDPHDPRIMSTLKVIDAKLRVLTDTGPAWYRYNRDGYGEKANGEPFDVVGIGRPWPLLAGERAHYELAAGRPEVAVQLLGVMRAQASDGGMLPEQVWDGADVPARELSNGRATGSAMPLVWAHAEYAKLVRSLYDGRVFDMPQAPYERYVRRRHACAAALWAAHSRARLLNEGCLLRVQTPHPARVLWTVDGRVGEHDVLSRDTTLGFWIADLDTTRLPVGAVIRFAIREGHPGDAVDEGHAITVVAPAAESLRQRARPARVPGDSI
ncbi:MAG: glycoside hydrolase family 15 protein [Gemmatimonadota bacterium]|nr:glycoside hydrolase family 15 protein [Gemmatimonadota bacterium]